MIVTKVLSVLLVPSLIVNILIINTGIAKEGLTLHQNIRLFEDSDSLFSPNQSIIEI